MLKIKYVVYYAAIILSLGLISCVQEVHKPREQNTWTVPEPELVSQEGDALDFTELNDNPNLSLDPDYRISFPYLPEDFFQLEIKNRCQLNNTTEVQFNLQLPPTKTISVREILPPELFLPQNRNKTSRCQFTFKAQREDGSTHSFDTFELNVVNLTSSNHLILKNGIEAMGETPILKDDVHKINAINSISTVDSFSLHCDQMQSSLRPYNKEVIPLVAFDWSQLSQPTPPDREPLRVCRLLGHSDLGQVIATSPLFSILMYKPEITIQQTTGAEQGYATTRWHALPEIRTTIGNPNGFPVYLRILGPSALMTRITALSKPRTGFALATEVYKHTLDLQHPYSVSGGTVIGNQILRVEPQSSLVLAVTGEIQLQCKFTYQYQPSAQDFEMAYLFEIATPHQVRAEHMILSPLDNQNTLLLSSFSAFSEAQRVWSRNANLQQVSTGLLAQALENKACELRQR
ncbi:MAG: hypothetical protein H6626_13410 [Pseudobdellovibrionaceae bacterium]|nr:hypothetical protein [Bdellovibrionales bacterium]USN47169.1 MAG: hypothetical protein H6626_13410 [Pseudobdellovibrionaceae bacterium]